jgi:hypothetical protein
MKKVRLRSLPEWPPSGGGTSQFPGGSFTTPDNEKTILANVYPKRADGKVTFLGESENRQFTYDYTAPNEKLADIIREKLRTNIGTSICALGDLEIEISEGSAA